MLMVVAGRGLIRPWIVRWPNLPAGTRSIGAGVAQSVCCAGVLPVLLLLVMRRVGASETFGEWL